MNSITLKPNLDELCALNNFIHTNYSKNDFQLDLIVEEVFVNIVNYSKTEFIKVNFNVDESLILEFVDNGIAFNPLNRDDPEMPDTIEDAQIGGLGIFMVKTYADELQYQYENGENHFKIVKNVK